MPDVFIAYSQKDEAQVRTLVEFLRRHGLDVWIAYEQAAGLDWDAEIDRVLAVARCVLTLWSPSAVESPEVKGEARAAMARGVLVTASLDGQLPPRSFTHLHVVDISGLEADEVSPRTEQLLSGIRAHFAGDKQHTPPPQQLPKRKFSRAWVAFGVAAIAILAVGASILTKNVLAVSCHDEGVFKLTGQMFTKNTSINEPVVCIAKGATIRVSNAAHLKIDAETLILEGEGFIDGRGVQGRKGDDGDDGLKKHFKPPAVVGIRICGHEPSGSDRADYSGKRGDRGGNGTPGATVSIRYGKLIGEPSTLKVEVAGGPGGLGGAGGRAGYARCKEGPSGFNLRGSVGRGGDKGAPGKNGAFTLEHRDDKS